MVATQVEMFPSLPRSTVIEEVRSDWNTFRRAQERLGGLILPSHAAVLLGVSRARVYQLIDSQKLRVYQDDGFKYVSVADVRERLANPVGVDGKPVRG